MAPPSQSQEAAQAFIDGEAARLTNAAQRVLLLTPPPRAGGSKLLTSAAVTLAVLRRALNCTLPVELVWHGEREMDAPTLAAFKREFGPLRGYNVAAAPVPKHHRQKWVGPLAGGEGQGGQGEQPRAAPSLDDQPRVTQNPYPGTSTSRASRARCSASCTRASARSC